MTRLKPKKSRQHGEGDNRSQNEVEDSAHGEEHGSAVRLVGSRCEQQSDNCRERHGQGAARPTSDDPEQRNGADHGESPCGADQGRHAIGHEKKTVPAAARNSFLCGLGDKQGEAVERLRDAGEGLARLVGKQPQRGGGDL